MKVVVYSNNLNIGTGILGNHLSGMGEMGGSFTPNENYHLVQKKIWELFASEGNDFHEKWQVLRYTAQLENGYYLTAVGDFMIGDLEELSEEPLELSLAGVLTCVFAERNDDPEDDSVEERKEFLSSPWQKISIEEKIAFEDELVKELGSKGYYDSWKNNNPSGHLLNKTDFAAIARNQTNDEVLFAIHGEAEGFLAIVNLTWSGKKETDSKLPWTTLFWNLDEIDNSSPI